MNNSHLTRDTLPLEILCKILQSLETNDLYNVALVSNALLKPAQYVLYSKVSIYNFSQFRAFYETVQQYPHLGSQVKGLHLNRSAIFDTPEEDYKFHEEDVYTLLPDLLSTHLPNLEELDQQCISSYTPVENALKNAQLIHLKRLFKPSSPINPPEERSYLNCVYMMKDRLENITLTDSRHITNDGISEQFLYDNLHQFNNLVDINISYKMTDMIEVLEHVTASCKSLKNIQFEMCPSTSERSNPPPVTNQLISDYIPCPNIKSLNARVNIESDCRMIKYIIQKFPQLQELSLGINRENQAELDEEMLDLLMRKISKMNRFSLLNVRADKLIYDETPIDYWHGISELEHESVKFTYTNDSFQDHDLLDIVKKDDSKSVSFSFKLNSSYITENLDYYIQENTELINQMQYNFVNKGLGEPSHLEIHGATHSVKDCPNVQKLHFNQCILKRDCNANIDLSEAFLMKELCFDNCILYPGMLEQLSLIMPEIELLHVSRTTSRPREDDAPNYTYLPIDESLEIFMPHTAISLILFEVDRVKEDIYIKLFNMTSRKYSYYQVEATSLEIVKSGEYDYSDDCNYNKRINICCLTEPNIRFKYNDSPNYN